MAAEGSTESIYTKKITFFPFLLHENVDDETEFKVIETFSEAADTRN